MLIQNGDRIVFTGDSVTDAGRGRPVGEGLHAGVGDGYVRQIENILNVLYPDWTIWISNTGSSDIVASMVVYDGAKPKKSAYRRFRMKTVTGHPDDYASMEEVLTRRLRRYLDGDEKFAPLPDVMLIDGGATHAAVAEKVCAALNVPLTSSAWSRTTTTTPAP